MKALFPIMYAGFWINALSGTQLFIAYPVRAVTNPGFFLTIAGVVLALLCIRRFRRRVFLDPMSPQTSRAPTDGRITGTSLFLWLGVVVFGRLIPRGLF